MKLSKLRRSTFDEGVWKEVPEFEVEVLVRSTEHIDYRAGIQSGLLPHQRRLRNGGMVHPATQDRVVVRAVARHLLLNWRGVEDDDGNPIPYSREKAEEMAEDPQYTAFFKAVERIGDELAVSQAEAREELGKS